MDQYGETRLYLARVLPWPQPGDAPAYINIHSTFMLPGANKPIFPGRACRSIDEAVNAVDFALRSKSDIYACMASQRSAQEKRDRLGRPFYSAIRNQANATALKALFLDIDLKNYASTRELSHELDTFLKATGLPRPTLMAMSGGGVHVYWTMIRALPPEEWQPLADALAELTKQHGLHCDPQCTVDSVRLLRIPGTFNFKYDPPRKVRLLGEPLDFDYLVDRLGGPLGGVPVGRASRPARTALPFLEAPGVSQGPSKVLASVGGADELAAGIEVIKAPPIDPKHALAECPFIRATVTTAGKTFAEPLWHLTTLLSTFMQNGQVMAHLMGRGHPGYTRESTDALYERKVHDREVRNLGWPSCQTISVTGAVECQSCPHFSQGKSPLTFALQAQAAAAAKAAGTANGTNGHAHPVGQALASAPGAIVVNDLPKGFSRSAAGLVQHVVTAMDGTSSLQPVCDAPLTAPWLQRHPWTLHFTTQLDQEARIALPLDVLVTPVELRKALARQGMVLHTHELKPMGDFLVSWINELKQHKEAVMDTAPFGWTYKHGKVEGFVYGDQVWTPNGTRPAANSDPVLANHYAPTGELAPWQDAASFITSQGRPDLAAILAASFASPLVGWVYEAGMVLSAYSTESGIGKSTVSRVAQAVWGDPVRARQILNDTHNSVASKLGEIRSLPLFWDELKTEDQYRTFVSFVFQLSMGKDKSRLSSSAKLKDVGTWKTLLVATSNDSLLDYVTARTHMTTAGLYRVFEFEVQRAAQNGQIALYDASKLVGQLDNNFGHAGLVYARFLGENFSRVAKEVGEFHRALAEEVECQPDERFWIGLIACLCLGARYAGELGLVQFDEPALKEFLLGVLETMRSEADTQPADMSQSFNVSNLMAQFLNAMRARHMLLTNRIHVAPGRPVPGSITIKNDITKLDGIYVHVGVEDKRMRVSLTHLSEWLGDKGYSRHVFVKALKDELGAKNVTGRIAAGTNLANMAEYLLEIDLAGSQLANFIDET